MTTYSLLTVALIYLTTIGVPATAFSIWIPNYFKAASRQPEVSSELATTMMIFFGALELSAIAGMALCFLVLLKP